VTVRLVKDFTFEARFDDLPGSAPLHFDEPTPLGDGLAPNAAAVLGAAVGNCLAASLAFCLRKVHIEPTSLTAHVTTNVVKNERGRFRIGSIDVEIAPELAGAAMRFDRCGELFEDFCVVTASVRRGIPVHVRLAEPAPVVDDMAAREHVKS
jgi:organic hydroperoxide reductase OsmC/OhrA